MDSLKLMGFKREVQLVSSSHYCAIAVIKLFENITWSHSIFDLKFSHKVIDRNARYLINLAGCSHAIICQCARWLQFNAPAFIYPPLIILDASYPQMRDQMNGNNAIIVEGKHDVELIRELVSVWLCGFFRIDNDINQKKHLNDTEWLIIILCLSAWNMHQISLFLGFSLKRLYAIRGASIKKMGFKNIRDLFCAYPASCEKSKKYHFLQLIRSEGV